MIAFDEFVSDRVSDTKAFAGITGLRGMSVLSFVIFESRRSADSRIPDFQTRA